MMECGKLIGRGNTADVYAWQEGRVLKLFHLGYSEEAVEKEFHNAKAIRDMDFAKPRVHEIILCEGRFGIVYEKVEGECLLEWVLKTGDVQQCAVYMAKLHRSILHHTIQNVSNYKDLLRYDIINATSVHEKKREEALLKLDRFPDDNRLCHGDFHPGNVFISPEKAVVIDFMNICYGDLLYDVARTVFLIEYTPVPLAAYERERLLSLKKLLADSYLMEMHITREMIQEYLMVITVARAGECPEESLHGEEGMKG